MKAAMKPVTNQPPTFNQAALDFEPRAVHRGRHLSHRAPGSLPQASVLDESLPHLLSEALQEARRASLELTSEPEPHYSERRDYGARYRTCYKWDSGTGIVSKRNRGDALVTNGEKHPKADKLGGGGFKL